MQVALQHSVRGIVTRGLAAGLALMLALPAALGQTEESERQTRRELEDLRDRMEDMRERLEAERSRRGEAERRIETLDREISRLATDIRRTEQERAAVRDEIARLTRRSEKLQARLAAQEDRVASLAYSAYVMGRQSHLKLLLNQQDPGVINRMLGYHDYIVEARAATIERINGWAEEIAALAEERQARENDLRGLEKEYRSEQEALRARKQEREKALAKLNERIASSEQELASLEENEQRLEQVLQEIREYLASRSRQLEEGAFRSMKGKMRLPVSAPMDAGFGQPRDTGVRWDGIMFRPDSGTEVSAIFKGRVVFADWLRGFGLLLIIDHGDGFMSLYSHNEALFKQVGDWVETEEAIATVGTSGGLDRPGLYFEIRQDGEPQDPLSWCQKA